MKTTPENIIKFDPEQFAANLPLNVWYPQLKIIVVQITSQILKVYPKLKIGGDSIFVTRIDDLPQRSKISSKSKDRIELGVFYFVDLLPKVLVDTLTINRIKSSVLFRSSDLYPKGTELLILQNINDVENLRSSTLNLWVKKLR